MPPRIVLACRDVPGWGGASTINYLLFERLQRDGFDVHCLNLVVESEASLMAPFLQANQGNPQGLRDVHTCLLRDPEWRAHANLAELIDRLRPDRVVGFGFIAAWQLLHAAPDLPLWFLTSGCSRAKHLLRQGTIRDFQDFVRQVGAGISFPAATSDPERQVLEGASAVAIHSPLVRFAFESVFSSQLATLRTEDFSIADLVVAEAASFQALRRPFIDRDIDLLFVASDWSRLEKNYPLVEALCRRFAGRRVHVVGSVPSCIDSVTHHGALADRSQVYALLGRARTVACPSLLDAAPGILFEAEAMGCNVVASPNCGNVELCAPSLTAPTCSLDSFTRAIERSWQGEIPARPGRFRGGYDTLVRALTAERDE